MTILRLTWLLVVMFGVFVAGSRTPATQPKPTQPSSKAAATRTAVSRTAVTNRAPLQQGAFALLPLGAIQPRGWLQTQLRVQADGLGGHLDEFWPDVGPNSAWLGGNGEGWERGPYFLDGLVPLAYQLNDPRLIAKTKPWIEWTLTHQRPDGAIGHYPFDEGVQFIVSPASDTAFPLLLRIPAWATSNVDIVINGVKQAYEANGRPRPGSFFRLERTWKPGDKVDVTFQMVVRGSRWFNDSTVIERGPIVYALDIGEDWQKRTTGMKHPARPPAADWEVHPTTPWNYALAINPDHLMTSVQVRSGEPRAWQRATKSGTWPSPFTRGALWTTLQAGARRIESWQMVEGSADAPPQSPVATSGPIENVRLIPYGMAKLRITAFPTTRP